MILFREGVEQIKMNEQVRYIFTIFAIMDKLLTD